YANLGLSSFINYTDLQIDGEALNAKALSYGIILGYKKTKEFDYALKYVKITQDTQAQLESITPNKRPSSDEFNIDLTQNLSKEAKIRLRYASINYAKQPLLLNEFDEHNLRIIFDYNFKINKK
ncbi:MAG: porin, partial [Sulfurimonadaceae bacterium]|nr:porin [Sulfurimonadaceae bacterium]